MKKSLLILFLLTLSLQSYGAAKTESKIGKGSRFRAFASLGAWNSNFKQSATGHETKINSMLSEALSTQLGFSIFNFFVEYNVVWLLQAYSAGPQARDASYFSPLGANVGLIIPLIPVEVYLGFENATYRLSAGLNPAYKGTAYKGGLALYFNRKSAFCFGLRAEYRKMLITSDDDGTIPAAYTTTSELYSLSFTLGGR